MLSEGGDDCTSHIRSVLTRSSEVIPIVNGHLQLGPWQGIFLFEHCRAPHGRQITLNVMGDDIDAVQAVQGQQANSSNFRSESDPGRQDQL